MVHKLISVSMTDAKQINVLRLICTCSRLKTSTSKTQNIIISTLQLTYEV